MSGGRRHRRSRSPESWSSSSSWSTSGSSMWASTTETDDEDDVHGGGHRWLKRSSSASLPVQRPGPSSQPSRSWVLLNRAGARRDDFRRDGTTSATSRTSRGEEISVSFELVEPPGTSVLTVNCPPASPTTLRKSSWDVVAAHRDVVLLAITSYENMYPSNIVIDLFVYQAIHDDPSRRRRRPSLLPLPSAGGPELYYHRLGNGEIGIMSCTSNDGDGDDSPPSFVVAELRICQWQEKSNEVRLFRSRSGQWQSFQDLHVHGANGGRDLRWWSTDAVVPYGRRYLIWVDYYRGMILMDLSSLRSQSSKKTTTTTNPPPPPPRLRYVPLPVDRVDDPEDSEFGCRGYPKASRRVCVTRHGVKFVSVDTQHWSNFGVGHRDVLTWNHRFRITTWSLREDDDDGGYMWRRDATMHEEEFWDAFDGGDRLRFPHVQPMFPVVDVDNPDVVVFRLENDDSPEETKWMIEVDLRKKVLLAAISYLKKKSDGRLSGDAESVNSARMKSDFDAIPSELPRYLDGGQACKKRRH